MSDEMQEVQGREGRLSLEADEFRVSVGNSSAASPPQTPLNLIVQVAGTLGTLAGLIYVIGATTLWLRAWLVGLPADVAIDHEPRSTVIALGLRGVLFVLAYFVLLAVLGAIAFTVGACLCARSLLWPKEIGRRAKSAASYLTPRGAWIALVDTALLIGCSFLSWRALALAAGAIALFGATVRWLDDNKPGNLKLIGTLGVLLGALLTGLGWQISGAVPVQSVSVKPAVRGIFQPMAYFGETDHVIYLGDVEKKNGKYVYTRKVLEVDRPTHLLRFNPAPYRFCRTNDAPGLLLVHYVFGHGAVKLQDVDPIRRNEARRC